MTMPYSVSRALFHGNGAATQFPFAFRVWEESQLVVSLTSPQGKTSRATGWSASLGDNGGTVTYLHEGAPLPAGWKLSIVRNMPFSQDIDLVSGARFDPQVIEDALDQATAERQQLLEGLSRAVQVEPSSNTPPSDLITDLRTASGDAVASTAAAARSEDNAAQSAVNACACAEAALASEQAAAQSAAEATQDVSEAVARVEAAGDMQTSRVLALGAVFTGCVLAFTGTFSGSDGKRPIPAGQSTADEGWALCDGDNGTPDLRGRMILGASESCPTGDQGGDAAHTHSVNGVVDDTTLTEAQMPRHTHSLTRGNNPVIGANELYPSNHQWTSYTGYAGSSQAHAHTLAVDSAAASSLPPYYTLAWIMKL